MVAISFISKTFPSALPALIITVTPTADKEVGLSQTDKSWLLVTNTNFSKRENQTSTVFNNSIWTIGGQDSNKSLLPEVWNSIDGLQWRLAVENVPFGGREGQAAVSFQGKLWIIGGLTSSGFSNDVWNSSDGLVWKQIVSKAPFTPRAFHQVTIFSDQIFVIGGETREGPTNDIWCSTDGLNWSQKSTGKFPAREKFACVTTYYKKARHTKLIAPPQQLRPPEMKYTLYVLGGLTTNEKILGDIWASEDGIEWNEITTEANFGPRFDFSAIFDGLSNIFVIGGTGSDGLPQNDVWFSHYADSWCKLTDKATFSARSGANSLFYKNEMWLLGGGTDEANNGNVWYRNGGGLGSCVQPTATSDTLVYRIKMPRPQEINFFASDNVNSSKVILGSIEKQKDGSFIVDYPGSGVKSVKQGINDTDHLELVSEFNNDGKLIKRYERGVTSEGEKYFYGFVEENYENGNSKYKGYLVQHPSNLTNNVPSPAVKDGEWACWYENGQLAVKGIYTNGVPNGIWSYWYPNGNLMDRYEREIGKNISTLELWYENGQELFKGSFDENNHYFHSVKDSFDVWDQMGHLMANGVKDKYDQYVKYELIWPNGKTAMELSSNNSACDGFDVAFYMPDGQWIVKGNREMVGDGNSSHCDGDYSVNKDIQLGSVLDILKSWIGIENYSKLDSSEIDGDEIILKFPDWIESFDADKPDELVDSLQGYISCNL